MHKKDKVDNKKVRVIFLLRSVGSTSMPWNDLYSNGRRLAPGLMYPPIVISSLFSAVNFFWAECAGQKRRYFSSTPLAVFLLIFRIYRSECKQGRLLVIHIHNPVLGAIGIVIRAICPKIKIVTNLHTDWRFLRKHQKILLYLVAKIADRFVGVSRASVNSIPFVLQQELEDKGRLLAIPNGINSGYIAKFERQEPAGVTAVVVARMVPAKNCSFILKLLVETPRVDKLIWFGKGVEMDRIKMEIRSLGIEKRIELRGERSREEVFDVVSGASIYFSASKWEGLGVANIEAMALGCWPFISDIPAHNELAETLDISTYSLNSINEWRAAIDDYLMLPLDERQNKQRELAEKTRFNYDIDTAVSKYIQMYRSLK